MFQPNQMVKVEDLVNLNEALRKSNISVGHQTGAVPDAGQFFYRFRPDGTGPVFLSVPS